MTDSATVPEELQEFLLRYRRAFAAYDAESVSSFYAAPCLSVSAAEVTCYPAPEDILSNFTKVMANFRSSGLSSFEYDIRDVRRYGADLLDARVEWRLRFTGRDETRLLDNVYTLRRLDGALRIVAVLLAA